MNRSLISQVMAEIARKGAKKRVAAIPPERRKEIGRNAIAARYAEGKRKSKEGEHGASNKGNHSRQS